MLDRYCTECHNPAELAGGLSLEQLDHSDIHAQAEIWEKVVRKLRGGLMPPPGGPRPEARANPRSSSRFMEDAHRHGRRACPELRLRAAASPQSQRVRERRTRSARARDRRGDLAAAGRQGRRLRQHRRRAASVAVVHRAIRHCSTHDRGSRARRRPLRARKPDVQEPDPGVAFGSTIGGGRPHHIDGLPLGTRGRLRRESLSSPPMASTNSTISDMVARAVGLQPRVREHADRHGRRRASVTRR